MFVYNFRFRRFRGDSLISGHLSKHWACYSLYRAASRAPDSAFTKTAWARLWHCAVEKPEALGASNASFFTDRNVHKHFCNLECWFLADQRIEHILDFLIICFLTEFMEHFCEFLSMIYFFTTMFFFLLRYYNITTAGRLSWFRKRKLYLWDRWSGGHRFLPLLPFSHPVTPTCQVTHSWQVKQVPRCHLSLHH